MDWESGIDELKKYGYSSDGGPGNDIWKCIYGTGLSFKGAALGLIDINCGSGDDLIEFDFVSAKVLPNIEKTLIDGGRVMTPIIAGGTYLM